MGIFKFIERFFTDMYLPDLEEIPTHFRPKNNDIDYAVFRVIRNFHRFRCIKNNDDLLLSVWSKKNSWEYSQSVSFDDLFKNPKIIHLKINEICDKYQTTLDWRK
jgi:hypothetical protein